MGQGPGPSRTLGFPATLMELLGTLGISETVIAKRKPQIQSSQGLKRAGRRLHVMKVGSLTIKRRAAVAKDMRQK